MGKRDDAVLDAIARSRVSAKGWLRGNCPWCERRTGSADRKQCLGLQILSRKWHCFRCGAAGRLDEMPDSLADRAAALDALEDDEAVTVEVPDGFFALYEEPALSSIACRDVRDYLEKKRGLPAEVCRTAGVGYVPDGFLGGRVVVPILDVTGREWLGYSARALADGVTPKYRYPMGMRRDALLYNQATLAIETDWPALIVEGCFDALALWPDGVAVLGKPSESQVEAMIAARRPVVVVLDGDAWREGEALSLRLRFEGCRSGFVRLPPRVDPDEVPRAELDAMVAASLLAA